jgi:hypothetical protein
MVSIVRTGGCFVKVRRWLCTALGFAKLHPVDCQRCGRFEECWGNDIRKRLEELREFERGSSEAMPANSANSHDDAA